jgi:hypothetical protein
VAREKEDGHVQNAAAKDAGRVISLSLDTPGNTGNRPVSWYDPLPPESLPGHRFPDRPCAILKNFDSGILFT